MDRKIKIFSLGRKNNIFIKRKECYYKTFKAISTIVSSFIICLYHSNHFFFLSYLNFIVPERFEKQFPSLSREEKPWKILVVEIVLKCDRSTCEWPITGWNHRQTQRRAYTYYRRKTNCRRGFVHRWNNFQTSGINSIKFLQVYYKCSYCFQTLKQ